MRLRIAFQISFVAVASLCLIGATWQSSSSVKTTTHVRLSHQRVTATSAPALAVSSDVLPQLSPHTPTITTTEVNTTTTTTSPVIVTVASPPTTQAPVLAPSSTSLPAMEKSSSDVWDCIISHESGGDPAAVNGSSGAGGLFQFLPSTWASYGGTRYAPLPEYATADQQWEIALAAQAQSGWWPWKGDGCTPVG